MTQRFETEETPSNPTVGDLWWAPETSKPRQWNGETWVQVAESKWEQEITFPFGGTPGEIAGFIDQSKETEFDWLNSLRDTVKKDFNDAFKAYDLNPALFTPLMEANYNNMFKDVSQTWFQSGMEVGPNLPSGVQLANKAPRGSEAFQDPRTWFQIATQAKRFMANAIGLSGIFDAPLPSSTRRGSGGTRAPTADDIRAQFDLDELTRHAVDLWRGVLLDEPEDARSIAKAYVETVVGKPEQKLDFESFVRRRIEESPRFKMLYRNKPQSLAAEQYLQFYLNPAVSAMGAGDPGLRQTVQDAMVLGSDTEGFGARLARTRPQTASAPFINDIQKRLTNIRKVLRD